MTTAQETPISPREKRILAAIDADRLCGWCRDVVGSPENVAAALRHRDDGTSRGRCQCFSARARQAPRGNRRPPAALPTFTIGAAA